MSAETATLYPVELYVYDLSHGMASQLSLAMTGRHFEAIYHTAIVVHGKEHFFGQGVLVTAPGRSHHGRPIEIIKMGDTAIDRDTWLEMLSELRQKYTAAAYHLLEFNCNTFSNEVSELLTGKSIPDKIRSLPQDFLATPLGQMFRPQIDSTVNNGSLAQSDTTPRARKNRKPSAAAQAGAQSEAAAASRLLNGVMASASGVPGPSDSAASDWNVAGKGASAIKGRVDNGWTLEKALETFLVRKSIFDDPELADQVRDRLNAILDARPEGTTPTASPELPRRILCLGLGSVKSGAVPQLQLGLLLLLRDILATKLDGFCAVEAFDPVFDDADEELLQALGIDVITDNQRGAYTLQEPTVVYMPHVGRGLTERLLRANYSEEGLSRLILCSNDLEVYLTNIAEAKLQRESPCIAAIATHLARYEVPQLPSDHPQAVQGALNDLAFQRFPPSKTPLPPSFWTVPPPPDSDDPELL